MAGLNFTSPSVTFADIVLSGGLNSTAGPFGLKNSESSELQNVDFDRFGSMLKRNGYACLNTAGLGSARIDGLYWAEFNSAGTTVRQAVCVSSSNIYKMDSLDGTWDSITGGATITPSNPCDFETFNNKIFITDGVNAPTKFAYAETANVAGIPTGLTKTSFVKVFENYLFYANVTVSSITYPTRIYWSAIRDDLTWDSADWIEIGFLDGQKITGLRTIGDRLVVFKERSIYNIYFTGDADIPFIKQKSNSAVGCIAPYSIQEVENGLVFLSQDGLYYYDGLNSYKISDRITNTLDDYVFTNARSMVQRNKNRYWLALATSTNNNRVVTWDYFNNAFSIYVGMSPSAMATFYVSGTDERPYFGDYSGLVYRGDTGTDDYPANVQTAINAYYYTNWRAFEDLVNQKGVPEITIYFQLNTATLTLAYSFDFENGDTYTQTFDTGSSSAAVYGIAVYGTSLYGQSGGKVVRRDLTGRGRVVRFKLANSNKAETFRIDGFGSLAHLETNI